MAIIATHVNVRSVLAGDVMTRMDQEVSSHCGGGLRSESWPHLEADETGAEGLAETEQVVRGK